MNQDQQLAIFQSENLNDAIKFNHETEKDGQIDFLNLSIYHQKQRENRTKNLQKTHRRVKITCTKYIGPIKNVLKTIQNHRQWHCFCDERQIKKKTCSEVQKMLYQQMNKAQAILYQVLIQQSIYRAV